VRVDVFAVFQSFDQNCSSSQQSEFVIGSQMMTTAASLVPQADMIQRRSLTEREKVKPRCDVCNRVFNSNLQALSHFRGASHNEEVIRCAVYAATVKNMQNSK